MASTAFRPAVVLTRASSFCVSSVLWLLAVLLFVILYCFILVEPSLSWSPQLLPGMTSLLCPLPSTGVPAASLQWFTQCPLSPHSLSTAKCSALLAPSDLHASSFSLLHSVKGSLNDEKFSLLIPCSAEEMYFLVHSAKSWKDKEKERMFPYLRSHRLQLTCLYHQYLWVSIQG